MRGQPPGAALGRDAAVEGEDEGPWVTGAVMEVIGTQVF